MGRLMHNTKRGICIHGELTECQKIYQKISSGSVRVPKMAIHGRNLMLGRCTEPVWESKRILRKPLNGFDTRPNKEILQRSSTSEACTRVVRGRVECANCGRLVPTGRSAGTGS